MKSQVSALLHVLQGLRKDCQAAYPGIQGELERDLERIALYSKTRGLGLFTLDLPALESQLLRGLDVGRLQLDGAPMSRVVSKRVRVPRLFRGLWLRVFERDASLKPDVDVTALAFLRQFLTLGKKLEVGCSKDRTHAVVKAYHDIEDSLRLPTLAWEDDELCRQHSSLDKLSFHECWSPVDELPLFRGLCENNRLGGAAGGSLQSAGGYTYGQSHSYGQRQPSDRRDERYLDQLHEVCDLVIGSFDDLDPVFLSGWTWLSGKGIGFKHGPGAVAERLKRWEKSQFPNWPHKLQNTFPFEMCGTIQTSPAERPPCHEVASRLIAVPKTSKAPRLIAAEPTSHQWCQQLLLKFLVDEVDRLFDGDFIDFRDQDKSGNMVLTASLDRSMATVDLSDASDRLTCWTVERVFRSKPSILTALHAARTRYIRDDISDELGFLKLRKFASQGTATTFPVMSIVMLCIALASSIEGKVTWQKIRRLRNQVRVFGDDIILPTHGYEQLTRTMELLQLKVNMAKSYTTGYFRESCGTDGYKGHCVTPTKPEVIVADSPASCQAVVDTSNNLFNKGYWYAATACQGLLPPRVLRGLRVVGQHDAGFRGLTSFGGSCEAHLPRRWNSRLHRYEVRVWGLRPLAQKRTRDGHTLLLDFASSRHSEVNPRIVSEYRDVRNTRDGVRWEPANLGLRNVLCREEWTGVSAYYSRMFQQKAMERHHRKVGD